MRAIDADELKERIRKALGIKSFDNLLPSEKAIVKQIDIASTIQPEPHWHPVSEQPQEDDDYLLLTYEKAKYGTFKRIIIGAWNGATKEWLEEYEGMYRDVSHPVAWLSKDELLLLKGWEATE